jgi:hypothetical protein
MYFDPVYGYADHDIDTVKYLDAQEYEQQQNELYAKSLNSAFVLKNNSNIQSPNIDRYISNAVDTPIILTKKDNFIPWRAPMPMPIKRNTPFNMDNIRKLNEIAEEEEKKKRKVEKSEAGIRNLMEDFEGGKRKRTKKSKKSRKHTKKSRKQRKTRK